jgi:hypothetical protein
MIRLIVGLAALNAVSSLGWAQEVLGRAQDVNRPPVAAVPTEHTAIQQRLES